MAKKRSLQDCRLYTFIDTDYLANRSPVELAKQLCDGGSDIIQLRAKNLSTDAIQKMAESILPIIENAGVHLVVNDHPTIAQSLPAPFVHLGQEDFFGGGYQNITDLFPQNPRPQLGLSTHNPNQCRQAIDASSDYVAIGPIYDTKTKPLAKPVTLDYVRWAAANVKIPWFAIGGINLKTLPDVLLAGAKRVCIVSAILQRERPDKACQTFHRLLPS